MTAPLSVFLRTVFIQHSEAIQTKNKKEITGFSIWPLDNVITVITTLPAHYVKKCTSIEGIIYKCENNKIISFQDNFKHLGDVPFTVCFDFKITTGDNVFHDSKMFVISFCQIYAFHPSLNLDKIVIFRSFQQKADKIYSLDHFRNEHIPFFNRVTFKQLKDATTSVLAREKSTSLSELLSVELNFTIDTLNKWFKSVFKSKFLEINEIQKQIFAKENPIDPSKTCCCICGFPLDTEASHGHEKIEKITAWYDFIVQKEHLFIRNIYSREDILSMENLSTFRNYTKNLVVF